MNLSKKIALVESLVFLLGWIIIFLLGADFPPPKGFWKIVCLVVVLDVIQYFYLRYLLKIINKEPTFFKNISFFGIGGIAVSIVTNIRNVGIKFDLFFIWMLAITGVSIIYGIVFWCVNKFITNKK